MKKTVVIVGVVIALLVVVAGLAYFGVIKSGERSEESRELEVRDPSSTNDSRRDDTTLNETSCTESGGAWNPCGSACRTDPSAICIGLCVEYCECTGEGECPSGYACGDFVDGTGVCL